ncbi:hypothetical protein ACJX0J_010230, partial [Zea mays]
MVGAILPSPSRTKQFQNVRDYIVHVGHCYQGMFHYIFVVCYDQDRRCLFLLMVLGLLVPRLLHYYIGYQWEVTIEKVVARFSIGLVSFLLALQEQIWANINDMSTFSATIGHLGIEYPQNLEEALQSEQLDSVMDNFSKLGFEKRTRKMKTKD